jgi:hypothetical protein
MAFPNLTLIEALRATAKRLREGAFYAWGHHGACNCGNLLQVVTNLSKETILQFAYTGIGEWTELSDEYCESTGTPVYLMISELEAIGLTSTDIHNLEYLEDRDVLQQLPGGFRWLKRNQREDVSLYFETFANMLEDQMLRNLDLNLDVITANLSLSRSVHDLAVVEEF